MAGSVSLNLGTRIYKQLSRLLRFSAPADVDMMKIMLLIPE
jgi:hypothetical protein